MTEQEFHQPGPIILFGSGETSPTGRKIFEPIFRSLPQSPRIALLETPAGFELNSHQVISRVADFFTTRLQNYSPQVEIIPARKRGTAFSPDNPDIVTPMLKADMIFMGPGSPTYAVRQLRDSLAWYHLIACHRLGATLALASAATVAFSAYALPVYEIYKAGEDIHWNEGLDFFNLYGLQLVLIPHWNNNEGGTELDTSRCFMGQERFIHLMDMLPESMTIIGLDEKTALIIDPSRGDCQVRGLGKITLLHTGHKHLLAGSLNSSTHELSVFTSINNDLPAITKQRNGHIHQYQAGDNIPMADIGPFHPYHPEANLPASIWKEAIQAKYPTQTESAETPPDEIMSLMRERNASRQSGNWSLADRLRSQIELLGWEVSDTKDGPVCRKLPLNQHE
jgi:cyanophycinase-like exopeptidase